MNLDLGNRRHRLYRSPSQKVFLGVCGGIAEYFGANVSVVRALFIASLILSAGWTLLAYFIVAAVIQLRPQERIYDRDESDFWRSVTFNPRDTYSNIKHTFDRIDRRMRKMESYVTSRKYELDREFADLERTKKE